ADFARREVAANLGVPRTAQLAVVRRRAIEHGRVDLDGVQVLARAGTAGQSQADYRNDCECRTLHGVSPEVGVRPCDPSWQQHDYRLRASSVAPQKVSPSLE